MTAYNETFVFGIAKELHGKIEKSGYVVI